jgi:hypothetical protein
MADPSGKIQAKHWFGHFVLLVLFSTIWICLADFPARVAGVSLDDSWQKSFAYFLKKGMQAGKDFVFTYGPLGYFNSPVYDRDLYWAGFILELATKFLLVFYLFRIFKAPFSLIVKIISLVLIALFLPIVHGDVEYLVFITLIGISLTDQKASRPLQIMGLVLLSALSLGKFVLFLFSSIVVFYCELRSRAINPRTLYSPILIFLVAYLIEWILARQSLFNFPQYIFSSLQIVVGYNESMAIAGNLNELFLSLFLLLLLLTFLLEIAAYWTQKLQIMVFITGLILAWKQGFTRQDNHSVIFFGYALVLVLLVVAHFGYGGRPVKRIFAVCAVLICIAGSVFGILRSPWFGLLFQQEPHKMLFITCWRKARNNGRIITSPVATKTRLDQREKERERESALPTISSRINNATIDIMSYQQGILLLNHMNWRPRPVFQSYSAYTAYLANRNAEFFRGPSSPEFLLYKVQPLDDRLPSTEDGLALFEIFRRYGPDATERSFLLFKKNSVSTPQNSEGEQLRKEVIGFDQEIVIDRRFRYQQLRLDIRDTVPGRIRKLFYKPPYIFIKLNMKSGITRRYRLLPALARNGFLLTPLILRTEDLTYFYQSSGGPALKSFTIETKSPGAWFQKQIPMEITTLPSPPPSRFSDKEFALLRDSVNSGFAYQIKESEADIKIIPLDISERASPAYDYYALFGEELVEADSVVLPKGRYRIVLFGYGNKAGEEFPKVEIFMDRKVIGTLSISEQQEYELPFQITKERKVTFGISFVNDGVIGKEDRNVFIKRFYVEASER